MKLLFDCDGTILDSMHIWSEPINGIFEKYGFSFEGLDKEEKGKIEALPMGGMIDYIAENIAKDMSRAEVSKYFEDVIEDGYKNHLMPKEGALEILKRIKEAGYEMAIASSTDSIYLKLAFERLGISDYFSFLNTPDLTDLNKAEDAYWQNAIDKFAVPADQIILYDDALYAINAAKKLGIKTCGLKDFPYNEREWEYIIESADQVLDTIADIDIENLEG